MLVKFVNNVFLTAILSKKKGAKLSFAPHRRYYKGASAFAVISRCYDPILDWTSLLQAKKPPDRLANDH